MKPLTSEQYSFHWLVRFRNMNDAKKALAVLEDNHELPRELYVTPLDADGQLSKEYEQAPFELAYAILPSQ